MNMIMMSRGGSPDPFQSDDDDDIMERNSMIDLCFFMSLHLAPVIKHCLGLTVCFCLAGHIKTPSCFVSFCRILIVL